jgi:hypothetical protein
MSKSREVVKAMGKAAIATTSQQGGGVSVKGTWHKVGEVVSRGDVYFGCALVRHLGEFKSLEAGMQVVEEHVRLQCASFAGWSYMWSRPTGDGIWQCYVIRL